MVRKFLAVLLFLYASWQIYTSIGAASMYGRGMGLGQVIWALLAILGGIYLWRRPSKLVTKQ